MEPSRRSIGGESMTAKRDLKKLVRARQARTGERYTTALEHVRGAKPASSIPVLELIDLTDQARALGFVVGAGMFSDLAEDVDGRAALERLREVLRATADDATTLLLRSVLLEGRPLPRPTGSVHEGLAEGRRFLARARAGIAGVSDSGRMIALAVEGKHGVETVVGLLWSPPPLGFRPGGPTLVLRSPRTLIPDISDTALMLLRSGWGPP
jgi:hypothetical protein